MDTVIVHKESLLSKVKENRTEHEKLYKESVEGYKLILKHELKEKIKKLEDGEIVDTLIKAYKPTNYLDEYDTIIEMLNYSVNETIELTRQEFKNYVLDDWTWKQSYLNTSLSNITGSLQYK